MIRITKTMPDNTVRDFTLDTLESGSWIKLTNPAREEIEAVCSKTGIAEDLLLYALDEEETPRLESDEDYILFILNVPKKTAENRFDTVPLSVVITKDMFVTVSLEETEALPDLCEGRSSRGVYTFKRTRLLLQIFYRTATMFLRYLTQINRKSDEIEYRLHQSMRNVELFELLELQKGLTYFSAALRTTRSVVQKLQRFCNANLSPELVKLRSDDEDLLEDVIVEYDQAYEMVQMYSSILTGMMDAFASIISNNLNIVMKFLTSITILLAIPTMVSSFWGMNVPVPWTGHPNGFLHVFLIALGATIASLFLLWKKRMF